MPVTVNQLIYHEPVTVGGEALGEGLGDVLGDALGEALGDALGDALGEALGDADGVGLTEPRPAKSVRSICRQNCVCCPLQLAVSKTLP